MDAAFLLQGGKSLNCFSYTPLKVGFLSLLESQWSLISCRLSILLPLDVITPNQTAPVKTTPGNADIYGAVKLLGYFCISGSLQYTLEMLAMLSRTGLLLCLITSYQKCLEKIYHDLQEAGSCTVLASSVILYFPSWNC